jgi:hypothetical protein
LLAAQDFFLCIPNRTYLVQKNPSRLALIIWLHERLIFQIRQPCVFPSVIQMRPMRSSHGAENRRGPAGHSSMVMTCDVIRTPTGG